MGVVRSEQSTSAVLEEFRGALWVGCAGLQRRKGDESRFTRMLGSGKDNLDEDERGTLVCVTSGLSYVGHALMVALLSHGYSVRVIVDKPEDVHKLMELEAPRDMRSTTAYRNRHVIVAKLTDTTSLMKAFEGCRGVFHTSASTDPAGLSGYTKYMADMEVEAAESVMNACANTPSVGRCVFTSSLAASIWREEGTGVNERSPVIDHNSWSNESLCLNRKLWYALGKTRAEKVAWRIANETGLKLTSICAGLITGQECRQRNTTPTIAYLKGAQEMYLNGVLASVDVTRLAEAHVCVFKEMNRNAHGRYVCYDNVIDCHEEAEKLAEEIGMSVQKICGNELSNTVLGMKLSKEKLSRLLTRSMRCYHQRYF